jgi:hypothetical protein
MSEGRADWEPAQTAAMVKVGIETNRGPWVAALVATGYEVFAINPCQDVEASCGQARFRTL